MDDSLKTAAAIRSSFSAKPAPLGRGLSALFGDSDTGYKPNPEANQATAANDKSLRKLPVTWLQPGQYQPRREFDETALTELAESIKAHGVLQPLLVRDLPERDRYEIIAGERRWRAAQLAGLHELPVIIRSFSNVETLEIGLIENLQREDLNALEEAEAYQRLITEFGHRPDDLAKSIGKSRSHIANTTRLLQLPAEIRKFLTEGTLSAGHARALLAAEDPVALAQEIIRDKLSVREVEVLVRPKHEAKRDYKNRKTTSASLDADMLALQRDMTANLGLKTTLKPHADGGGEITIAYRNLDQLEDLIRRLRF
jgi:ParB family transcriptional regulator, chromosome partitioning protein